MIQCNRGQRFSWCPAIFEAQLSLHLLKGKGAEAQTTHHEPTTTTTTTTTRSTLARLAGNVTGHRLPMWVRLLKCGCLRQHQRVCARGPYNLQPHR